MCLKSHKNVFFICDFITKTFQRFVVNLIRTMQTVSLQRDNCNIKMCLNSSEIRTIFSSANTVSSINLIFNIPGYMKEGEWCD